MRFKPVPEPPADLETVADVRNAVPPGFSTVSGEHADGPLDCCTRVIRETDVGNRDDAGTWLTFLRALELVRVIDGEYVRTERAVDPEALRPAFRERVHGVDRIFDALEAGEGPLGTAAVIDRVGTQASGGGRRRSNAGVDPEERTERVLEWGVLLDVVGRTRCDGERRWSVPDDA